VLNKLCFVLKKKRTSTWKYRASVWPQCYRFSKRCVWGKIYNIVVILLVRIFQTKF